MAQQLVYSVMQLNRAVQRTISDNVGVHGLVLVRGEIGSLRVSSYGGGRAMVFFNLHEGDEALSCVSFGRSLEQLLSCDRHTGEIFSPPREIGDVLVNERKVICEGVLGTYTRRGQSLYQLTVRSVTDCGAGDRMALFRKLRDKLARLGYFAEERKRPLPVNPGQIALVTSPTGAVIHDFLRNAQDRGLGLHIRLYPVRVQGDDAGAEIAAAVEAAGKNPDNQVVVIIRGGGSEEDLSCFNDEALAKAIFECPVPVLTGIGHEVDMSLADFTADVSASTPTKAAQMLLTPRADIQAELDAMLARAKRAMANHLASHERELSQTEKMLRTLSPERRYLRGLMDIADLEERLYRAASRMMRESEQDVWELGDRAARAMDLLLERERANVDILAQRIVRRANYHLDRKEGQLDFCAAALERAGRNFVRGMTNSVENLSVRLEAANPLVPLQRGFALIHDEKGRLVRSVRDVKRGEKVNMQVADGSISAVVQESRASS